MSEVKRYTWCRMKYVIPGDPIPLARPRHGVSGHVYDTQKHQKFGCQVILAAQHKHNELLAGPLHLDVVFFMPMTKTAKKKWDVLRLKPHIIKPDLDNLVKMVCDLASGILLEDDCIICSISAKKVYDDNPRTEFNFELIK